jgi:hypothetical protein
VLCPALVQLGLCPALAGHLVAQPSHTHVLVCVVTCVCVFLCKIFFFFTHTFGGSDGAVRKGQPGAPAKNSSPPGTCRACLSGQAQILTRLALMQAEQGASVLRQGEMQAQVRNNGCLTITDASVACVCVCICQRACVCVPACVSVCVRMEACICQCLCVGVYVGICQSQTVQLPTAPDDFFFLFSYSRFWRVRRRSRKRATGSSSNK